jgi:trimeric autotransporter adhesin
MLVLAVGEQGGKSAMMIRTTDRAGRLARLQRAGSARRTGRLAAVAAVATAAAMAPAAALASGGGRAAPAGHPARAVAATGVISTVAGGVGGPGAALNVALPAPCGMALAGGNLYVADQGSVRKVSGTGSLTTPAGTGVVGRLGDGGPAVRASLGTCGLAVDHAGNLVIADRNNSRIRVVAATTGTFYGRAMAAGDIYTVAGNGTPGFSGDGGPATAAELQNPWDVRVDGAGNLVISDQPNHRIRVVAASTGTFYGRAMAARHVYTVAGGGTANPGDGGPATSANLASPAGVALDAAGNLVIADSGSARIRVVAVSTGTFYGQAMTAGHIYTVAGNGLTGVSGDGGLATSARLNSPTDPALDHAGNLVIADSKNHRVRVVAASTGTFYGRAMTARHIYTVAGNHKGSPVTAARRPRPC